MTTKQRAPRNRTIEVSDAEARSLSTRLVSLDSKQSAHALLGKTICQDLFEVIPYLPDAFVDLLIADPPYNLDKSFNGTSFKACSSEAYESWFESWLAPLRRILKPTASLYLCGDWRSSSAIQRVAERYFTIQNRITWEREKGRGALTNWKNCSEDIWFMTVSRNYLFNVDAVKVKRKVIAPYKDVAGMPKDWDSSDQGNFRLTYPSNLWTDISVPFWSMPENTDHPTQKPEKLVAKLILASSTYNSVVFDPFLGSGTTSVVADKLGRNFVGIEIDRQYCCLAEKRLALAKLDHSIQGYHDGVFWERNSLAEQRPLRKSKTTTNNSSLFDTEDT
ncbi:MAG TPA: site-specific DNA-methyltransferase [Gemmatales bacterium]|nr:site-specific DNA-methyltransferase [Gemmatales bacterium]